MIAPQHLLRAVQRHWSQTLPVSAPTLYPGMRLETAAADRWYELWMDAWSDGPRRSAAPDRLTVSLLVHCFSRDPVQKTAVHALASAARETLAGRRLPITDDSAEPRLLGWLAIGEHAVHDLSRNHAAIGQEGLQHLVLVFQAVAEEIA